MGNDNESRFDNSAHRAGIRDEPGSSRNRNEPVAAEHKGLYELIASNTAGVMHGGPVSFTTSNDVFALPPGEIGITNATLHGLVHPNGFATFANFEWG